MTMNFTNLVFGFGMALATAACNPSNAASVTTSESAARASLVAPAARTVLKATKVIFVGKEHPCDCTRKTLEAGWEALQKALGTPAKLPVERLQIDTEGPKVEPYRRQKPFVALPAIYFVDDKGTVTELLQGEVASDQIGHALGQ